MHPQTPVIFMANINQYEGAAKQSLAATEAHI